SKKTKLLIELYKKISYLENKQDSLNSVYKNYANSPAIDSILPVLREEYSKNEVLIFNKIKDFILANLTSMAGLVFIDKLNPDLYGDLYIKYDSSLTKNYKNNPFIEQFNQHVEKALRLAIGKVAPEIEETDTAGKKVKLSSLRGKVVLIDFWASWCGPCRRESPNMVRIYNKYKSKGFEIFGVSLDKNKESWLSAIKKDNLKWTHISDLGYWDSRPGRAYSVSSIPYTVLIDDKGRILAKGLRGEELEEKLEQFFNNNPK
ncbi:MAG: TlpA family protein disulfide reductase, partial [Bacteroidales bacterium]|nr:TlpA family protein disulfide reductase [Bacteroidales bacterium]